MSNAGFTPIQEQLYVIKDFENLILQKDEIVKFNVKEFVSGSFLGFNGTMTNIDSNETMDLNGELIKLTDGHEEIYTMKFSCDEYTNPLHDSSVLITDQTEEYSKRTYLFFVNECYQIVVLDFTFRQNNKIERVFIDDLRNVISRNIRYFSILDLFCNEMVTVTKDELFFIPCYASGRKFLVWFNIYASKFSFTIDSFASEVSHTEVDRIGRNSMVAYTYLDQAYVMSSSVDSKNTFTLTVFSIINAKSNFVTETYIGTYKRKDFDYDFEGESMLEYDFNLRDLKIFNQVPYDGHEDHDHSDILPALLTHNIIASCFNNGILFFQTIAATHKLVDDSYHKYGEYKTDNESPNALKVMTLTHVVRIPQSGKLFSFNDFYSIDELPYKLFVTKANPASVYELSINNHFNVRIDRIYTVSEDDVGKFIGQDILSMNRKFIAHLLFDLEDSLEVIRIYYRNETNFAYGHSDLKLKKFLTPIATINFLDPDNIHNLFVRNAFRGDLFQINDIELAINTRKPKFDDWVNKTFTVNITAYNSESPQYTVSSSFRLIFADSRDMNSYYIGDKKRYDYGYSYGDPSFSEIVSDFYYGPDLKFNVIVKEIVGWEGYQISLPNITNTADKSKMQQLHDDSE
jgi:hypothetical protein